MNLKFLVLFCLSFCFSSYAQNTDARSEYIGRFRDIAIKEMKRAGVPASIKLAQGILESSCGNSPLARNANNHFGIKCASSWKGSTYLHRDDDYDENGQLIESCFRAFENAEACYIAHSEFLCDPQKKSRYGFLFLLDPTDYRSWAKGLSSAGYATSQTYADALIRIIEECRLYEFDSPKTPAELVRIINDVKMVTAKTGQTPEEIARLYHISSRKILSYNEGFTDAKQQLAGGDYVYLQRKRIFFRGNTKYHTVQSADNMFLISQRYGIKLSSLYWKNRMKPGTEPALGQKITLKGRVGKKNIPVLRSPLNQESKSAKPTKSTENFSTLADPSKEMTPADLKEKQPVVDSKKELPDGSEDNRAESSVEENPIDSPEEGGNTPSSLGAIQYVVKSGDTLYGISRKFGLKINELRALNPGVTDVIKAGQILILQK